MTAAAGVAGLTQVASASAATMGAVNVTVSVADANNAGAGQGAALNLCRSNFPSTQSVQFDHSEIYESGGAPAYAAQIWRCSDTP